MASKDSGVQPSRPISASYSAAGYNDEAGSLMSHYNDRSAVLTLTGSSKVPDRPLPGLLSQLVDAAHHAHEHRKVLHPQSAAYSMFQWRTKENCEAVAAEATVAVVPRTGHVAPPSPALALSSSSPRASSASGPLRTSSVASGSPRFSSASSILIHMATGSPRCSSAAPSSPLASSSPSLTDLEVQCLYDANFQAANAAGQHGAELRAVPPPNIGPIAYLYRWYCKRATHFVGSPRASDLPDAPAMPPEDSPAPTPAREGFARSSLDATTGRCLNRALDPVMNLAELTDMLEDLHVVPQLASRADVAQLFSLVARGRAPVPTAAAAAAAAPGLLPPPLRAHSAPSGSIAAMSGGAAPAAAPTPMPAPAGSTYMVGSAVALASAQVHPDEIRYPQFLDLLLRLGLATACLAPGGRAAGRVMSRDSACTAVRGLLRRMGVDRTDIQSLKQRLSALARTAADKGSRTKELRMAYVAGVSCLAAAQGVSVEGEAPSGPVRPPAAAGAMPVAVGAVAGTSYAVQPPWSILALGAPAPPYLQQLLAEEDKGQVSEYRPRWREFAAPSLDLGPMQPGELRTCRLLLHNRGVYQMAVRLETAGAPFCRCTYAGLHALLPGVPKHIEVVIRLQEVGEVVGELRLYFSNRWQPDERMLAVPIYARVGLPTADAQVPVARSERASIVSRGRSVVPPVVAAAAALTVPLSHHAPPPGAAAALSASLSQRSVAGGAGSRGASPRPASAALNRTRLLGSSSSSSHHYSAMGGSAQDSPPGWLGANGSGTGRFSSLVAGSEDEEAVTPRSHSSTALGSSAHHYQAEAPGPGATAPVDAWLAQQQPGGAAHRSVPLTLLARGPLQSGAAGSGSGRPISARQRPDSARVSWAPPTVAAPPPAQLQLHTTDTFVAVADEPEAVAPAAVPHHEAPAPEQPPPASAGGPKGGCEPPAGGAPSAAQGVPPAAAAPLHEGAQQQGACAQEGAAQPDAHGAEQRSASAHADPKLRVRVSFNDSRTVSP